MHYLISRLVKTGNKSGTSTESRIRIGSIIRDKEISSKEYYKTCLINW